MRGTACIGLVMLSCAFGCGDDGGGGAPDMEIRPLAHGFGDVAVGETTAPFAFTIENVGDAAATGCTAPVLGGANFGDFTIVNDGCGDADLAAGASCEVTIAAKPSALGTRTATLSRECDGRELSTTRDGLAVTGIMAGAPNLFFSPTSFDFGSAEVAVTSPPQQFGLGNSGSATAEGCAAPTLVGANASDFVITSNACGATLAPQESCLIEVAARPTDAGARSATLQIACTTGGTPSTTADGLTVNATFPTPAISDVNPYLGPAGGGQTVTITGTGFVPGSTASIGEVACATTTFVSPTEITCLTAPGTPGWYLVVVTNPDDQVADYESYGYNSAPTLAPIADQTIVNGFSVASVKLGMNDIDGGELTVQVVPADTTLFPLDHITIGGFNYARTIDVEPATGQFGTSQIMVTVSDGIDSTTQTFAVTVRPSSAAPAPYTNGSVIAMASAGDDLYIAGGFTAFRPERAGGLMRLDPMTGDQQLDILGGFNSQVRAVVVSGNAVYVGGLFDRYRGAPVQTLAKIDLATGELDRTFNARMPTNAQITSMVLADGALYIAGGFSKVGDTTVQHLAKLDPATGAVDTTFTQATGPSSSVSALAVDGSSLYLAGYFATYRGAPAQRIAKVDLTTGALDTTFTQSTGFGSTVQSIVVANGAVYAGGDFRTYRGIDVVGLAKLDAATGALDTTFAHNTTGSPSIYAVAEAGGALYVGGFLTTYRGTTVESLVKVDATTGVLDTTFSQTTGVHGTVFQILPLDGALYVTGGIDRYRATAVQHLLKLDPASGALDTTFTRSVGPAGQGYVLAAGGGSLWAGGDFSTYRGTPVGKLAKLSATTGALDTTFTSAVGPDSGINALAIGNGALYIGGSFDSYRGQTAHNLAKVDLATGALDTTFTQATGPDGVVDDIAVTADSVYIAGAFAKYRGSTAAYLARLAVTSGALDATFHQAAGPNSRASRLVVDGGALYVAGHFWAYRGASAPYLAKVDRVTGELDKTFTTDTGSNGSLFALAKSGNSVFAGGNVTNYRNATTKGILKVSDTDGALDVGFIQNSGVSGAPLAFLPVGSSLYVIGNFSDYHGTPIYGLVKVDLITGALDTTFSRAPGLGGVGNTLVLAGGKLWVGGSFRDYRGVLAPNLVAVDPATGAY